MQAVQDLCRRCSRFKALPEYGTLTFLLAIRHPVVNTSSQFWRKVFLYPELIDPKRENYSAFNLFLHRVQQIA